MDNASKIQETKNKLVFNKLIKDHWGYTDSGYNLFRERLLFSRPIAKEYKKIIGNSPDLRKRFSIDNEDDFLNTFKENDRGFAIFKRIFNSFRSEYDITYSNFNKNKFIKDKNEVKLFKGIRLYYFDLINKFYDSEKEKFLFLNLEANSSFFIINDLISRFTGCVLGENNPNSVFSKLNDFLSLKVGRVVYFKTNFNVSDSTIIDGVIYLPIFMEEKYGGTVKGNYEIKTLKEIQEFIDFLLTQASNIIGKYKSPSNRKMELVISLNPIDWLLCSTSEKWSSCLSLDSNYLFWVGLPGLIGDKNRALAYITNGEKKTFSFTNGKGKKLEMKVDKFISRSWLLLARRKKKHDVFLDIVREYPNSIGLSELVKKNVSIPILEEFIEDGGKFVGRYYIETIPFKLQGSSKEAFFSPYFDSCSLHVAKKNKAKYKEAEFLWYKFNSDEGGGGTTNFIIDREQGVINRNCLYFSESFFDGYQGRNNKQMYKSRFDFITREGGEVNEMFVLGS